MLSFRDVLLTQSLVMINALFVDLKSDLAILDFFFSKFLIKRHKGEINKFALDNKGAIYFVNGTFIRQ